MRTSCIHYNFRGAEKPPAVASRVGTWCSKNTGSSTVAAVSGGSIDLALDATSEVQNSCLYMGDILPFDIDDLIRIEFIAKVSASLAAAVSAVLGVAGARNDTQDSVAQNAWFKLAGSNSLLVETDDGTTDNDDIATGESLSTTYRRLVIDFATGVKTQSPPSLSLGGKAAIQFFVGDANGVLKRVAKNTNFDMSAYASNLQILAQIQKTTGTAVGTLSISDIFVEHKNYA